MATAASRVRTFTFDERARRYRDSGGRFVSDRLVRAEFEKVKAEGVRRAGSIATRLQTGAINTAQFQIELRDLIKSLHTVAGATAGGGWAQMSPAMWGRVGNLTKSQYAFLNNFALQIQNGLPLDGRFLNRVALYAKASSQTYENFRAQLEARNGKALCRRVLHAKESCGGCVSAAALGFIDINEMLASHPIGSKECQVNCLCSIEAK